MAWVMNVIFTTLFSYIGWYMGEPFGMGMGVFLSLNGLIVGWMVSKRFMKWLEE